MFQQKIFILLIYFFFTFFSFSEELPSRCKKEILSAADYRHDGQITFEGLYQIICNIGATDKITKKEIGNIFEELGDDSSAEQTIAVKEMLKII